MKSVSLIIAFSLILQSETKYKDNMKEVIVLIGAGAIDIAIARRVSIGKILVLADLSLENANRKVVSLKSV